MGLDPFSIFFADVAVTFVLGLTLLLSGLRSRAGRSLRWWGSAYLLLSVAVAMLPFSGSEVTGPVRFTAVSLILLAYALMWHGARAFERRAMRPFFLFGGAGLWLTVSILGLIPSAVLNFSLYSLLNAGYCMATAYEFWRGRAEKLNGRWWAIGLSLATGVGFFGWILLSLLVAGKDGITLDKTEMFPVLTLGQLLARVAMALVMLGMVKERLEVIQRAAALTDPLTGLPNRRAFFRNAIRRLRTRNGGPTTVAVLLFDLDQFKAINDRYGHAIGDRILKRFADSLTRNLKDDQVAGRIGGEEFAALLPDTDVREAAAVAEQIRKDFAEAASLIDEHPVHASVSVGGVAMNCDGRSPDIDTLLLRADVALYSAKEAGRNCVKVLGSTWSPHSESPQVEASAAQLAANASPPIAPVGKTGDEAHKAATEREAAS